MTAKKTPIKLRQRKLASGRTSLYLDIYAKGVRHYEYLNLYLEEGSSREVVNKNRDTLRLAEAICAKRVVEFHNGRYGFKSQTASRAKVIDYCLTLFKGKETATNILRALPIKDVRFSELDRRCCECILHDLRAKGLADNTISVYMSALNTAINQAIKDDLITDNPLNSVKIPARQRTERIYLTTDEVKKLVDTPCYNDITKRAFLFSCLTGLRFSDISKLKWGEVREGEKYTRLVFTQKKTRSLEYIDISKDAVRLMGERMAAEDKVFVFARSKTAIIHSLNKWVAEAKIDKHVTFHTARHTFAVMMLSEGVDIYTVSKLLGHKSIATTQIYANVVDKTKQAAVEKLPKIFGNEH